MAKGYIKGIEYKNDLKKSSYLLNLSLIKYLSIKRKIIFDNDVTFFTGENGTGKSTLIEAIALCAGFNAEGGF